MLIQDDFDQPTGVGDIIVYATQGPYITRAEVLEIVTPRVKRQYGWSDYKMKVAPEGNHFWGERTRKVSTLVRAPFVKVATAISFEDYRASLMERYEPIGSPCANGDVCDDSLMHVCTNHYNEGLQDV